MLLKIKVNVKLHFVPAVHNALYILLSLFFFLIKVYNQKVRTKKGF